MYKKRQIGKIVWLFLILLSYVNADAEICKKGSTYFLTHFLKVKNPEKFNMQWAECELKLGNEDAAISAYERVLIYYPNNLEAVTALARLYSKNHMNFESEKLKQSLDNSRLTPQQRQVVSKLLDNEKTLISTRLSATLNYGYDDNLNFGIYVPQFGKKLNNIESSFNSFSFNGNHINELDEVGGFSLQGNWNFYVQNNKNAHYYDVLYGSVDAGVGYGTSTMLLYLPLVYRHMETLDTYLYEQYGIAPRLTLVLGKSLLMNVDLKYLRKRYIDNFRKDGDDTLSNLAVGLYQFYGKNYIYAQAKYNHFNADSITPVPFVNYNYFQFFAGASYELEGIAILDVNYQYGKGHYQDHINNISNIERSDDFNQINVSVQRELINKLTIITSYNYTNNNSNYQTASYSKQILTIGVQYNY